ncbi:unnamed protein product, partial [Nesidiocoris tenuis]
RHQSNRQHRPRPTQAWQIRPRAPLSAAGCERAARNPRHPRAVGRAGHSQFYGRSVQRIAASKWRHFVVRRRQPLVERDVGYCKSDPGIHAGAHGPIAAGALLSDIANEQLSARGQRTSVFVVTGVPVTDFVVTDVPMTIVKNSRILSLARGRRRSRARGVARFAHVGQYVREVFERLVLTADLGVADRLTAGGGVADSADSRADRSAVRVRRHGRRLGHYRSRHCVCCSLLYLKKRTEMF